MHCPLQEQLYCDFVFKQRGGVFTRHSNEFQTGETSDTLKIQEKRRRLLEFCSPHRATLLHA